MKVLNAAIALFLIAGLSFAEESAFTGQDYLKLSKRQRVDIVTSYINDAKEGGVVIKNKPVFYCRKLDAFYDKHNDMKKESLPIVLKTLVIMEYDWQQKGVDKDKLAKEWLGDDLYTANKTRLEKR